MNEPKTKSFIRLDEVKRLTGMSRSSIYARPDFPQRVKLGKSSVGWVLSEIEDWIEARIDARQVR